MNVQYIFMGMAKICNPRKAIKRLKCVRVGMEILVGIVKMNGGGKCAPQGEKYGGAWALYGGKSILKKAEAFGRKLGM